MHIVNFISVFLYTSINRLYGKFTMCVEDTFEQGWPNDKFM